MSERIGRYLELLRLFQKATPEQQKLLLETSNGEFIKALCECCLNATLGHVQYSPKAKRKLKKYAPVIRKAASKTDKDKSVKRKRQLLVQHGGFLPALLAPIISLAGGLIGELVAKKL